MEIRKPIEWYEWLYEVSDLWNFKSLSINRLLKPRKDTWWYNQVNLKWKIYLAHRIVAKTFIENIENKATVNHKNWIRNDNRIENLEWCSFKENIKHSRDKLSRKNISWWKHYKSKIIHQYSLSMEYIRSWECLHDITRELWFDFRIISEHCLWKRKWWYGYIWRYW